LTTDIRDKLYCSQPLSGNYSQYAHIDRSFLHVSLYETLRLPIRNTVFTYIKLSVYLYETLRLPVQNTLFHTVKLLPETISLLPFAYTLWLHIKVGTSLCDVLL